MKQYCFKNETVLLTKWEPLSDDSFSGIPHLEIICSNKCFTVDFVSACLHGNAIPFNVIHHEMSKWTPRNWKCWLYCVVWLTYTVLGTHQTFFTKIVSYSTKPNCIPILSNEINHTTSWDMISPMHELSHVRKQLPRQRILWSSPNTLRITTAIFPPCRFFCRTSHWLDVFKRHMQIKRCLINGRVKMHLK